MPGQGFFYYAQNIREHKTFLSCPANVSTQEVTVELFLPWKSGQIFQAVIPP